MLRTTDYGSQPANLKQLLRTLLGKHKNNNTVHLDIINQLQRLQNENEQCLASPELFIHLPSVTLSTNRDASIEPHKFSNPL